MQCGAKCAALLNCRILSPTCDCVPPLLPHCCPYPSQIFMSVHDPTTPNRQGNDVGPQYRSIVLYGNEEQKRVAEEVRVSRSTAASCTCTYRQLSPDTLR